MKKFLALMMSLTIILNLASCKKESIKSPVKNAVISGKTYVVKFNLKGFNLSKQKNASLKKNALADDINLLYYYAYSRDGFNNIILAKQKVQSSMSDPNFGLVTDTLPAGEYEVFFVGTRSQGHVRLETGMIGIPTFYYADSTVQETYSFGHLFDISDSLTQDIVLTRANSLIRVKLLDTLPINAASLRLRIDDFPLGLSLRDGAGLPGATPYPTASFIFPITAAAAGTSGFTVSTPVWSYYYPNINVDCFDGKGNLIATKLVTPNIHVVPDTRYTFSGKAFEGNIPGNRIAFTVTVDTAWSAPVDLPFNSSKIRPQKSIMVRK